MGELPDDPDQLKAYIEYLLDQLEFKDESLTESEKTVLELKQDLDEARLREDIAIQIAALERLENEREDIDLDFDGGGPSKGSAGALDDATGYDNR